MADMKENNHTSYLITGGFMEEFFERVDEIACKIDQVTDLIEALECNYSTISSSSKRERELEQMVDEQADVIKRHLREANLLFKGIEVEIKAAEETSRHSTEHRIKHMQYMYLEWRLNNAMNEFNVSQNEQHEKLKTRLKREILITEEKVSDEQIDEMIEHGNFSMFTSNIIVETEKAKQDLEIIVNRHNDILTLEKRITEIHSMFMDLAILVESQGDMVDNIERNVVETHDYVISGGKQLKDARNYRDKARRTKFYCIGCCLILLIVVAIVLLIKFA
ncbi:syntaxin-like [Antedon mediterranea]|uniref:syntaxin-like n=1 Tax=Antedon mediterranea TaxID=105859 RepID=UPI003AF4442F